MAWFNRGSEPQKYDSKVIPPIPKDTNCEDTDYEKYIWMAYTTYSSIYWKDTVKWEKLEVDFYRATLTNGDIIFFIAHDNQYRYLKAEEAKFNTEKQWIKEFARRLNFIMDRRSVNQLMLSEKTGISKSSLSYYLNCKRVPSVYTVRCLADALNTTVEFLSGF